jgi:REP element-mobilizing transposase RayT
MHEWQNLSHVRWDCKYHVVIVPKYPERHGFCRGVVTMLT